MADGDCVTCPYDSGPLANQCCSCSCLCVQALSSAAVSEGWPGGVDPLTKRPQPLLYSLWIANHTPAGSGSSSSASGLPSSAAASSSAAAFSLKAGSGAVPSPMARYKHTLLKCAHSSSSSQLSIKSLCVFQLQPLPLGSAEHCFCKNCDYAAWCLMV